LKSPTSGRVNAPVPQLESNSISTPWVDSDHVHRAHEARGRACVRLVPAAGHDETAAAFRIDGQLAAEGVVDVDHARLQVRTCEQARLRVAVVLHAAVVVEVVARQVGERGGPKAHGADARLIERVRGHFHRDARRPAAPQFGQCAAR
jgi:hypothetical protein